MFDLNDVPSYLPPDALSVLQQAGASWEDEAMTESLVLQALALAPDTLAARIGAYKFYFYRHRLAEALPHAQACLEWAAEKLQLPRDWRDVQARQAGFTSLDPMPRLWLQIMLAMGYCLVRVGRETEGLEVLEKVAQLDTADKFGARRLADIVRRGEQDEDED